MPIKPVRKIHCFVNIITGISRNVVVENRTYIQCHRRGKQRGSCPPGSWIYLLIFKQIAEMLYLIQRCTIMNKFGRCLGRILAETYLKMDYFGSKSQKIAPLASGGSGFAPRPPFKLND